MANLIVAGGDGGRYGFGRWRGASVRPYAFFFSSRRRHTRWPRDWSSDVCSSDLAQVQPMVEDARAAGLGVTIHVGEEGGEMGRAEIGEVLELLRPDRIGHGILAAGDTELMRELRD